MHPRKFDRWEELYLRVPNRVLAAWNCLRGRPTIYRIKSNHGVSLHDMNNVVMIESRFVVPEGETALEINRVQGGKFIANSFVSGGSIWPPHIGGQ
jgi:hypothetical protein